LRSAVTSLIVASSAPIAAYPLLQIVAFPNDYRYLVKISANTSRTDCNNVVVAETGVFMKHIDHDDYLAITSDPFHKADGNEILYFTEGDNIIIDAGTGVTITSVTVTYIKLFQHIQDNVTNANGTSDIYTSAATNYTELASDTHEEFVDIAVKMVLENIESQRYQTNSVEITQQE
jgi:hypothetical protein